MRIHNPAIQRAVFEKVLGMPREQVDTTFGHLLESLGSGCPPHAGAHFQRLIPHFPFGCACSSRRGRYVMEIDRLCAWGRPADLLGGGAGACAFNPRRDCIPKEL